MTYSKQVIPERWGGAPREGDVEDCRFGGSATPACYVVAACGCKAVRL